ncbi:MAG: hypothetical protein WC836_05595 [Desulfobacula sp.]
MTPESPAPPTAWTAAERSASASRIQRAGESVQPVKKSRSGIGMNFLLGPRQTARDIDRQGSVREKRIIKQPLG